MKPLLTFFILFSWHIHALESESTLKIYHNIFSSIMHKMSYTVYTDKKSYYDIFLKSNKIILTNNPEAADILLITKKETLKKLKNHPPKGLIFTTNYTLLSHTKNIIGAFYWRKGRSQLLFIKNRLKKYGVTLPKKYTRYIIDTL